MAVPRTDSVWSGYMRETFRGDVVFGMCGFCLLTSVLFQEVGIVIRELSFFVHGASLRHVVFLEVINH